VIDLLIAELNIDVRPVNTTHIVCVNKKITAYGIKD